eukprot:TRINITY_DN890_c1_g1_i1.p1 TRINITY_DN890_c1_g1~~TRINITY_DN890_c1_g1_i1.p1  ORF type:complete len:199 (-),score=55.05 TRINITY_DN890_c1_g1_i1:246-842(-)
MEKNSDLIDIVNEISKFLQDPVDELKNISTLKTTKEKYCNEINKRENYVKQIVKDLSTEVNNLENNLNNVQLPKDHENKKNKLLKEKETVLNNITNLDFEQKKLNQTIELLNSSKKQLNQQKDEIENIDTVIEPRKRHELSLYVNITKIIIDKDQLKDSQQIKGIVQNKYDIRPFSIDTNEQNDRVAISDMLWDLMDV